MTDRNLISTLNRLIETCRDGQEGFRTAAEDVEDTTLKSLFSTYSMQRAEFVGELQDTLINLGETRPEDDSSITGTIHRGWMNIKQAVSSQERQAILNECERGENAAVNEYEKALDSEMPDPIRQLVQRQYNEIREARNRITDLREKTEAMD